MRIKDGVLVYVEESDIVDGIFKIPDGVTEIGENAFYYGSKNLTNIKIPDGVTKIGHRAFYRSKNLTNIEIPEGVTEIGSEAFVDCSSLTNIEIPKGVTEIGENTFYECKNLTNIKIYDGVTKIGHRAFGRCIGLTNIEIPEGVTEIGSEAFVDCSSLTNIEIPVGVTKIEERTFARCNNLTNIKIPNGVTEIGNAAFGICKSLTNIEIPEGVKRIGEKAFRGCIKLVNIKIPESIVEIGRCAFNLCYELDNIKMPNNASTELCTEVYMGIIPDNSDKNFYNSKEYILAQKILFGKDYKNIQIIKNKTHFNERNYNYDEHQMDIFYSKMINSIGIDEIERMIELPNLSAERVKQYALEKDEAFQELYDTEYKITGDFGITLKLLKQLQALKDINGNKEKNSIEMRIFRGINEKLEEGYNGTITELVHKILEEGKIEVSPDIIYRLQELEQKTNNALIKENLTKVEEQIESCLSNPNEQYNMPIVQMQIIPIKAMIEDTVVKLFKANGRLELATLKEKLEEKMQSAGALYIRQNTQQIVDNVVELLKNKEILETLNHSCIDALRNTKEQIGGAWKFKLNQELKKLGYTFDSLPENFSKEEIEKLNKILGNIQVDSISVPKEGIEREKAYELLEKKNLPEIVTYQQIHDMFGPVHEPYSEQFKEFFKKHREEFLRYPQYYERFGQIHNNFEKIINSPELKNIYQKGKLTLDNIVGYMSNLQYANQRHGDEELAKLSKSVGQIVTEKEFEHVQKVFDITKKRERSTIPPILVARLKYRGRMLNPDDVLNLFAGNITTCCQKFGDVGEGSMMLGSIEENGGIFVVEELNEKGQTKNIIGQSLTIRQKGEDGAYDRLTFDNIEINNGTLEELSQEEQEQILEIYKQAGKQAIEKDKKFLRKLLRDEKITQEQYDRLVLKEVIAGTGYNDLKGLDELPEAKVIVPDEAYYKYNEMNGQQGEAWIDSAGGKAPKGSNGKPVIIAHMDDLELRQIKERKNISKTVEINPKDIPLWYGKVGEIHKFKRDEIKTEQVDLIKKIEKSTYREEQQLMNENDIKTVDEIEDEYGIHNANLRIGSNNDWYLIYGEDEDSIVISDFAVIGGINAEKHNIDSEEIKSNPKLAIAESSNEMYDLLIHAGEEEKGVICNATADTSLMNIIRMAQKGLVDVMTLDGEKVKYEDGKGLVYLENNQKVENRDWDEDGNIQMLDLKIIPNVPQLVKEKKKIEGLLRKTQEFVKMQGRKKEKGLDELRRQIRKGNNTDAGR